jgi:hypothetical protein
MPEIILVKNRSLQFDKSDMRVRVFKVRKCFEKVVVVVKLVTCSDGEWRENMDRLG